MNRYEEVKDQLELLIGLIRQNNKDWLDERDIPVLEKAIEAVEKQIPMKPLQAEVDCDGRINFPCANCGNDINNGDYCPWCGQKVWWGEEE